MTTPNWPWELPPVIAAAAFVPALLLLVAVFAAGGHRRESLARILAFFLGGALLSAPVSAVLNQWIVDSFPTTPLPMAAVGAPVVEEVMKALIVVASLAFPGAKGATFERLVLRGCCVGLGFTAMENTQYLLLASLQGGPAGLARGVFVRGLAWGFHHAVFTAAAAAGVWQLMLRPPRILPALAWASLAVALHIAWNALGAAWLVAMLCDAPSEGAACRWPPGAVDLFLLTPLVSVLILAPGLAALLVAACRSGPGRVHGRRPDSARPSCPPVSP